MWQEKLPRSSNSSRTRSTKSGTIAGKVFLLGEYSVLAQGPALVAAVGPRFATQSFKLTTVHHPIAGGGPLASGSPFERLRAHFQNQTQRDFDFKFDDPYQNQGGFGASTAEFALAYGHLMGDCQEAKSWISAWQLYRQLHTDKKRLLPSGADLACQWVGGVVLFQNIEDSAQLTPVTASFPLRAPGLPFIVLSGTHQPGRKVATHLHLETLSEQGFPHSERWKKMLNDLSSITQAGVSALQSSNAKEFGNSLSAYAKVLSGNDLENPLTREDREFFSNCPQVLGAKGSGAMQSDAVLIALDPASSPVDWETVLEKARQRNLKPIAVYRSFLEEAERGVNFQ